MNTANQFGLPQHVIDKLSYVFKQHALIQSVIIYGSRALGTYRLGSDIDLCIDAEVMGLTELFVIDNQIDDLSLPWRVDLVLKHQIDNPALLDHINHYGKIFL